MARPGSDRTVSKRWLLAAALAPLTLWFASGCEAPQGATEAPSMESRFVSLYPEAVEVRLFVHSGAGEGLERYEELQPKRLTAEQRARVEAAFREITVWEGDPNAAADACFIPNHFLRYYGPDGRQVGELAVCFCCHGVGHKPNVVDVRPPEGAERRYLDFDAVALGAAIRDLGFATDVNCSDEQRSSA